METERPNIHAAPEKNRRAALKLLIAAVIFALIGTIHWVVIQNKAMSCTEHADGTITEISQSFKLKGAPKSRWTVTFTAEDGREYTIKSGKTSRTADVGETVEVLYDPHKPKRAFIEETPPGGGLAEFICAGISMLAAVICLSRKPKKKAAEG